MFDFIGITGVTLLLAAFFQLQRGKLAADSFPYLWLNLLGAVGILVSLIHAWNLSAFVIETAWAFISLYGIIKAWKKKAAQ